MTTEIQEIALSQLHVATFHHRSNWSLLAELRDSIAQHKIICPLVVRARDAGGYEVGAGVCRMKAAAMAGLTTAPCIVVAMTDEQFISLQVHENRKRAALHPMDEALYCQEFHSRGHGSDAIAKHMGLSKRDVAARMRLLGLSPHARAAFVDGKLDEESALAMATLGDVAKQTDILSALESGSLHVDEVPGYIRREFTTSLDDVPWRMTDEKLVAKSGACSACPKRSDVQKELFPSGATGLRCLDVDCWRGKMDATWQAELARPGVQRLDQSADTLFSLSGSGDRPSALRSSGMVDADAPCPHLVGRTWREGAFSLVQPDDEGPTVYLCRDQDGRPRFVMREAVVGRMVKKSDEAKAAKAQALAAEPVRPEPSQPASRGEGRVRRNVMQEFARLVVGGDFDTWRWVVERIIDGATPRAVAAAAEVLAQSIRDIDLDAVNQLEGKSGLLALASASNRQARRVATAILIFEESDLTGEIPESIRILAAESDIDMAAIERGARGR